MTVKNYDFAGWATKNDIKVSDGTVIRHNAFSEQDGAKVPLVWEHDRSTPSNIIGSVILHNRDNGVYAYGTFNDTETARDAKELLVHGDINAMSIAANRLKRNGESIMHGNIFEVSLVVAGANPGALIDTVVSHSDKDGESAIIYPGTIIHAAEDELKDDEMSEDNTKENDTNQESKNGEGNGELDVQKVLDSLTDDQLAVVSSIIDSVSGEGSSDSADEGRDKEPGNTGANDDQDNKDGKEEMKHNVFEGQGAEENKDIITHSQLNEILTSAIDNKTTLKHAMETSDIIEHADNGIANIETLFPEAENLNKTPHLVKDEHSAADEIVAGTTKSPFSRIKSTQIDITEDDARARGYIKQNQKIEQMYKTMNRETTPTTIYTKTKFDRDDIIDITDFDVVAFAQSAMKIKFNEELARAILFGDGRPVSVAGKANPDKIDEDHIRPIAKDDDLYAIKVTTKDLSTIVEDVVLAMGDMQGSGQPKLYANPKTIARMKLIRKADGTFLYGGAVPSVQAIAATLGVAGIVETTAAPVDQAVIVNLKDYVNGATRGGQLTTFNDFDIDFNQYKYLLEGRLSGALRDPKTAMVIKITDATSIPTLELPVNVKNTVNTHSTDSAAPAQG